MASAEIDCCGATLVVAPFVASGNGATTRGRYWRAGVGRQTRAFENTGRWTDGHQSRKCHGPALERVKK